MAAVFIDVFYDLFSTSPHVKRMCTFLLPLFGGSYNCEFSWESGVLGTKSYNQVSLCLGHGEQSVGGRTLSRFPASLCYNLGQSPSTSLHPIYKMDVMTLFLLMGVREAFVGFCNIRSPHLAHRKCRARRGSHYSQKGTFTSARSAPSHSPWYYWLKYFSRRISPRPPC